MKPYINRGMVWHWIITRIGMTINIIRCPTQAYYAFQAGNTSIIVGLIYAAVFILSIMIFLNRKQYSSKLYLNLMRYFVLLIIAYLATLIFNGDANSFIVGTPPIIITLWYYSRRKQIFDLNVSQDDVIKLTQNERKQYNRKEQVIYDLDSNISSDYSEIIIDEEPTTFQDEPAQVIKEEHETKAYQTDEMIYCNGCGKKIHNSAKFCQYCGRQVY